MMAKPTVQKQHTGTATWQAMLVKKLKQHLQSHAQTQTLSWSKQSKWAHTSPSHPLAVCVDVSEPPGGLVDLKKHSRHDTVEKRNQRTSKSRFLCWENNFYGVKNDRCGLRTKHCALQPGFATRMSGAQWYKAQTARDYVVGENGQPSHTVRATR